MCKNNEIVNVCKGCGQVLSWDAVIDLAVYVVCRKCYAAILKEFLEEEEC
jgi:ribosomal protein L40E